MKRRAILRALRPGLLLLPLSVASFGAVAAPVARVPAIGDAVLGWQLTQARVRKAGVTTTGPQGSLTAGYVVEATARAVNPTTPIQNGTFEIELNAFSPSRDMPGQKAGVWYVQGDWRITKRGITHAEGKARHSPSLVNGSLKVDLPFNPATGSGLLSAQVRLPRAPQGGHWASGSGTFSGNERFEGVMQIDAQVWPEMSSAR